MPIPTPKNILVAPLDWGAGHTTRCMPLIGYLRHMGHNPIVAGNNTQLALIKETYGNTVQTVHLEGYNITYSGWNRVVQLGLLSQIPGLMRSINREHEWLKQAVNDLRLHGIISDNRYGLYHSTVPSVILTHQLRIQSGMGSAIDNVVQTLHYKYLNRFGATWVVDTEPAPGLAGALSHPFALPARCRYVGLLSRFGSARPAAQEMGSHGERYMLVLLSGPEPQRTNLSRILWRQVQSYKGRIVFAEGSDSTPTPGDIPPHISHHKRLGTEALLPLLQGADMIICRSGYSTIMDLVALGKKAILIPTPGQTEQEYLGRSLHERGMFYSTGQDGFELERAMKEAGAFPYASTVPNAYGQYMTVVDEWVEGL